jgi:hypothetical protein
VCETETGMVFISTRERMIHIYHEDSPNKLSEVETVKTEYGAKTIGVDPKTHSLILISIHQQLPRAKPGNFPVLVYGR